MTTESRMREALRKIVSLDFASTPVYEDFERAIGIAREALSPPARRTEYEWVGRDEIRYKVSTTFGVLSLSYYHEWKGRFEGIDIDDADNVRAELAAAIATLAGLTKPGEEA